MNKVLFYIINIDKVLFYIINIDKVLFYIIQLNKVTFSGGASFTVVKNKCVQVKTEQWISNETAFKA